MKKVFLTIALAAFAFAANAQFVVGGNLGFYVSGGHHTDDNTVTSPAIHNEWNLDKTTVFEFGPKIGYNLNEKMQVGVNIDLISQKNVETLFNLTYDDYEGTYTTKQFGWEFAPYFRYNVFNGEKLTFFCQANLELMGYGVTSFERTESYTRLDGTKYSGTLSGDDHTKMFCWGIHIAPGVNWKLNDHVSFDFYLNMVSLGYASRKVSYYDDATADESVNVYNDFGLNVTTAGLSMIGAQQAISVAFNYAF